MKIGLRFRAEFFLSEHDRRSETFSIGAGAQRNRADERDEVWCKGRYDGSVLLISLYI